MLDNIVFISPMEIEKKSFEIIGELLQGRVFDPLEEPIVKRVIHTTADLEYADTLKISPGAVESALHALREGCDIVTDTTMALSGINKRTLNAFGGQAKCFIADERVAKEAKEKGVTRSTVAMDYAVREKNSRIFAVGNAPTALIRLYELIQEKKVYPALVVGVPVGFVNVVESKELLKRAGVPYIVAEGRKGGSNVAAAVVNALLYMADKSRGGAVEG